MSVGQVHKHVADFLHKEGDTPFEQIHFSWQMERVRNIFILLNVHFVIFDQNNCALVVVLAAVVGGTEDGNNRWESLVAAPAMHLVAIDLHLVGADDGNEVVCLNYKKDKKYFVENLYTNKNRKAMAFYIREIKKIMI